MRNSKEPATFTNFTLGIIMGEKATQRKCKRPKRTGISKTKCSKGYGSRAI